MLEKLDAVRAGIIRLGENVAKNFDVLVALLRLNMLDDDFLDHRMLLMTQTTMPWVRPY